MFYSRSHLRIDLALIPLLGNVAWETKKFPTHTQDLSMVMSIYERESESTYPCRSLSGKRLRNTVDVVERLRDPNRRASRDRITIRPDLVPNGRHLRVQHTYNLMTISASLIQQESEQRGRRVLRRRDGAAAIVVEQFREGFA